MIEKYEEYYLLIKYLHLSLEDVQNMEDFERRHYTN